MNNQQEIEPKPIAVLGAVAMELAPLRRRLKFIRTLRKKKPLRLELREGPMGPVCIGLTGMGEKSASKAIQELFEIIQPRAIISAGFAGALTPNARIGDLLLADSSKPTSNSVTAIPLKGWRANPGSSFQNLETFLRKSQHHDVFVGGLLSSPAIVSKSSDKRRLAEEAKTTPSPVGVDMETAAICETLIRSGHEDVPFYSIRAVSDSFTEDLDIDFEQFQKMNGQVHLGPFLKYFVRNPRSALRLRRLIRNSRKASEVLGDCLYQGLLQAKHLHLYS